MDKKHKKMISMRIISKEKEGIRVDYLVLKNEISPAKQSPNLITLFMIGQFFLSCNSLIC